MGSVRSVVVVELLPLGQLFLEGHVVVCRNSAETGKLPFGRYRSLESDGLQGAGRIGNALFLRSVAVATPLVQNVMERSTARKRREHSWVMEFLNQAEEPHAHQGGANLPLEPDPDRARS